MTTCAKKNKSLQACALTTSTVQLAFMLHHAFLAATFLTLFAQYAGLYSTILTVTIDTTANIDTTATIDTTANIVNIIITVFSIR